MSDTLLKVRMIVAEQAMLDLGEVKPESTLADLGVDSLGLVEIVFAIEEAFDVTVPFNANDPADSAFDISNVDSIINAVAGLVAAKEKAGA